MPTDYEADDKNLAYLLGSLVRDMRRHVDNEFKDLDLSRYEWLVLACLKHKNFKASQNHIKCYLGIDDSYLTKVLDRLEAKHIIIKSICQNDRRVRIIKVSPEAEDIVHKACDILENCHLQLVSTLSMQEKETLFTLLNKVKSNIGTECDNTETCSAN